MTKVCHIISAHARTDSRVFRKECSSLAANGYDVTLLCSDGLPDIETNGVKIHSISFLPKGRMQQFFSAPRYFFKAAVEINADIYHIHEPFLLPVGKKLKKLGKKVIFDSHEDTVADISEKRYIPKPLRPLASKLYQQIEKGAITRFDAVISVTPTIVERLAKYNPNAYMITNYPKYEEYHEKTPYLSRRSAICFAGLFSDIYRLTYGVKAIGDLDCDFNLAVNGHNKEYLARLKQYPWFDSKVKVFYQIPYSEVIDKIYMESTIGIALICYNANFVGNIGTLGNTKLFEYMMMGLPVVCTDFVLWKQIVQDGKCGICVKSDDYDGIHSAIKYLVEHKEEAAQMGANGRKLFEEKYNWNSQEKILLKAYEKLLICEKT